MGWKTVRERYRINHIVCVRDGRICIGSGYIGDLIVIGADGAVVKRYDERSNDDLLRYMAEMDADPQALREAVQAKDVFASSIPVYTYDDDRIIEKACEVVGWPNVTHDGDLMYENTHSTDRDQVVKWAKANLEAAIRTESGSLSQARKDLAGLEANLAGHQAALQRLLDAESGAPGVGSCS